MLDWNPLGGTGRVVANGDGEPQGSADGVLKRFFPGVAAQEVTSSAVSQDEQLAGG